MSVLKLIRAKTNLKQTLLAPQMKLSFRDILEEIIFICSMKIISLKFAEKDKRDVKAER